MADWLKILETIKPYAEVGGEVASGIAKNRAAGRQLENQATTLGDQQNLTRYSQEQLAKLGAARLGEEATQDRADRYLTSGRERAAQSAWGDALANLQDVNIDLPEGIPRFNITGGLRPSMFGANARQAGQTLSRDALAAMMSGADVPDLPNLSGLGANAPEATPMAEANWFDKALEYGSYAGDAASSVSEIQRRRKEDRDKQEAAQRQPLPTVNPYTYSGTITPGFEGVPDISGQGIAPLNVMKVLADLKAAEDAAKAGSRGK